jgi:hypothetical protein
MAEIRTVTTFRSKRPEIIASIAGYEKRLAQARADLSNVNGCIALLEARGRPDGITGHLSICTACSRVSVLGFIG